MDRRRLRLRHWRHQRVLSMAALAKRAGVAKDTIVALEKPDHHPARPSTVRKLAAALGIEPAELYEEAIDRAPHERDGG